MARSTNGQSDYLIIGAGSAGCVLANRLSEDPDTTVTLVEAGGNDRHLFVRMPSAFYLPIGKRRFDWCLRSEPEPYLNHRRLQCPRGRVLGGSSSINGMVYVRGHPLDFERWAASGAKDWDYAHCLPYFRRAQSAAEVTSPDLYRGHEGLLKTTTGRFHSPLFQLFLEATEQAGYARSADLNGYLQEGFGKLPMTVAGGERVSAATAYLAPARRRSNLVVRTATQALKILLEGQRAVGAQVRRAGKVQVLRANKAVILCAGAIHSPHLLLLSGIGDPQQLEQCGVPVRQPLPGVGRNLMDHLEVYVQHAATQPVSIYQHLSLIGRAGIGARWLLNRSGLGATNHFEAGGFTRSDSSVSYPDIQFHFLPAAMSYDGSVKAKGHGYQVHVGPMLSPSRGSVTLASPDPLSAPRIAFNYMSCPEDWRVFRSAIKQAREIFAQPAFAQVRGTELAPGYQARTDAQLDAFVRAHAESAYHPCGTCRMGEDPESVVDSQGRVHALQGLRVVDASVFPHITNGNLNAPTIMLAERMADLIRGRQLAPEPQVFYAGAEQATQAGPLQQRPKGALPGAGNH
ncbi:MAG: choline dehydrogenase [Pseudomonadales bacterium]